MSERLIYVFLGDTPIHLADAQGQDDPQLLWKVVLRTGTWKLRPGPGGVKLNQPLKIFRDKAPAGHISMASLKQNFEAAAKEHVTVPMVHADGTTSDGGFVKKLAIQDVPGEDGSGTKESLLWAGLEITDSELKKKLDERSIRGVSGGILFDYERTEDAKKFDQILSHVMVTNSPWINGTGDFQAKLPEGVMASEPEDLPIGEVEFAARETEPQVELPVVHLDDPPKPEDRPTDVLWKPEQGLRFAQEKISSALRDWRDAIMANFPPEQRYSLDWPRFSVSDVSLEGETGTALITSGYGADGDTWVANFKLSADQGAEIDPFAQWKPAKQEWVAAAEPEPTTSPPKTSARPAGRGTAAAGHEARARTLSLSGLGLREAQTERAERLRLGAPSTLTGGSMPRLSEIFSGVELSEEQREAIQAQEAELAQFEKDKQTRREQERQAEVAVYCGTPDGQTPGVLDNIGLGDPGIKKYVRNALLSDDGGPAIELSEVLDSGQKTAGVPKTATELLKGFIDILPKTDEGHVSLSAQVRRVPDDPKPPETSETDKLDLSDEAVKKRADEWTSDMRAAGFDTGVTTGGGA